jgi:hypothetical protein
VREDLGEDVDGQLDDVAGAAVPARHPRGEFRGHLCVCARRIVAVRSMELRRSGWFDEIWVACSVQRNARAGGASVMDAYLLLDVLRFLPGFDFPEVAGSVGDIGSARNSAR